jgi:hypothetical protein
LIINGLSRGLIILLSIVGHVGYPQLRADNINLWVMWVISLESTHNAHNWKHFAKGLGTGIQSVGHVGTLDSPIKSLAYNTCADTTYKIHSLAIYPFNITHNTHKQAGSGSQAHSPIPTTLPTIYTSSTPKTLKKPKPCQCSKNPLRLPEFIVKIRRAVDV